MAFRDAIPAPTVRRPSRRSLVRFAILVAIVAGGFVALRYPPIAHALAPSTLRPILDELGERWWSPLALLGIYAVLCPLGLPATPLIIVGSAVFGPWLSILWNWLGTIVGSLTTYLIARALGRDFVEEYAGKRIRKAEHFIERAGFWALAGVRFVPVPMVIANAAAAVIGVPFLRFLLASMIGLFPTVAVMSYFSATLLDADKAARGHVYREIAVAFALLLVVLTIPLAIRRIRRVRRYKSLRASRKSIRPGTADGSLPGFKSS